MPKKAAIIDLGTNTFNLLIIEIKGGNHNSLYSEKVGVGLGLGGINEGKIGDAAWERGIETLRHYRQICLDNKVDEIHAFGTSAIRNASNSKAFIDDVKAHVDIDIQVISGDKEAELIYRGVSSGYQIEKSSLVMDIGGGSTEFILASKDGIQQSRSFEIGVSRIFQLFKTSDPYTENDCRKIYSYLEEKTEGFFDTIQTEILLGSSGSFETFYELVNCCRFPEHEYVNIKTNEMLISLNHVIKSTLKERNENPLIIPIRKKMAPIAALKIKWVIEKLGINEIYISPYALKEGVISTLKRVE